MTKLNNWNWSLKDTRQVFFLFCYGCILEQGDSSMRGNMASALTNHQALEKLGPPRVLYLCCRGV